MLTDAKHLSGIEKTALAEIKRRVSARFQVRDYILFGSKARGDFEPDSDVDLLVVTEGPLTYAQKCMITHDVFEVNLERDTNFSYVCVDRATWDSELWQYVPLHQRVAVEGVPV
jgi:predicted nucleotidyltransferase